MRPRSLHIHHLVDTEFSMTSRKLAAAALAAIALLAAQAAGAMNLFAPTVSNSGTLDGGSIDLAGTLHDPGANARPWVGQLYAGEGECLRLAVTTNAFDAKLTVFAPTGAVYRDDDGNGDLRPLVKIASAPASGWYTVQLAQFNGAPVNQPFHMLYGRYIGGNINCENGTVPLTGGEAGMDAKDTAPVVDVEPEDPAAP